MDIQTIIQLCLAIVGMLILAANLTLVSFMYRNRKGKKAKNVEKEKKPDPMSFSKRMLLIFTALSIALVIATVVGNFCGRQMVETGVLAAASFVVDGTWGGFYLWKSKNNNRSKYAQKFVTEFADKYGVKAAIRIAEVVLKD